MSMLHRLFLFQLFSVAKTKCHRGLFRFGRTEAHFAFEIGVGGDKAKSGKLAGVGARIERTFLVARIASELWVGEFALRPNAASGPNHRRWPVS